MPNKRRSDTNEIAKRIVDVATGKTEKPPPPSQEAVARGKARARFLSPERRAEIARKAARARWEKKNGHP